MILEEQLISNMFYSIRKAIERIEIARLWYLGNGRLVDIPIAIPSSGTTHNDLERLFKRTASIGKSIIDTRRSGAITQVSYETKGDTSVLSSLGIQTLAERIFNDLFISGIAGIVSYRNTLGILKLSRMGGYLEYIRNPDNTDEVMGIMQILQNSGTKLSYNVRIYEFLDNSRSLMKIWKNVVSLERVFSSYPQEQMEVPTPQVVSVGDTPDDSSSGEGSSLLGLILGYAATSMKIERVADAQAFPILWIQGIVNQFEEVGPNKTFVFDSDGSLNRLEPGDLSQLRELRNDLEGMINSQFNLPGRVSGGNFPSGEALQEARLNFTNVSRTYATTITQLLNNALRQYSSLGNVSIPNVVIESFEGYELNNKLQLAIQLYKEGIIPIRAVATLAQQLIPTWSDEELEKFLQQRETQITPEEAINMLGI